MSDEEKRPLKSTISGLVDDERYDFVLVKVAKRLGLAYRVTDNEADVVITGILPDTPASEWNGHCDLESTICVGDVIVSANQKKGAKSIVQELRACQEVECKVWKAGPRWHIQGTTAESMDKIEAAKFRGLHYELQEIGTGLTADQAPSLNWIQMGMLGCAVFAPNALVCFLCSDMLYGIMFYTYMAHPGWNTMGNGLVAFACFCACMLYVFDVTKWKKKKQILTVAVAIMYAIGFGGILKCGEYPQTPLVVILFHLPVGLGVLRASALKQVKRSSFYTGLATVLLLVCLFILAAWLTWMNLEQWDGVHQWNQATKDDLIRESRDIYRQRTITINDRTRSLVHDWDCDESYQEPYDFVLDNVNGVRVRERDTYRLSNEERQARATACAKVKTTWFLIYCAPLVCCGTDFIIFGFCVINGVYLNVQDTSKLEKAMRHFILMISGLVLTIWVSASVAGASMRLASTIFAFCFAGIACIFIWIYLEIGQRAITTAVKNSKIMQSLVQIATSDWFRACLVIGFNILIPMFFIMNLVNQKVRKGRGIVPKDAPRFTDGAMKLIVNLEKWNWASILVKANLWIMLYWLFSIGVAKITYVFLSILIEWLGNFQYIVVLGMFFVVGFIMFMLPPVPGIAVYISSGIVCSARARTESFGFVGGTLWAVVLSFVLKICAVCGQYAIGYFMGKSVKVQQTIKVDKVGVRGIERILSMRGLKLPKVAVLVGGPDWPTSVLCGILKLNLLQCCIGTTPVIFVSTPCVIAGAFMANPEGKVAPPECTYPPRETTREGSSADNAVVEKWGTLATTMLTASLGIQLVSAIAAVYFIQEVVHKHSEELAKPRKEHEAVAALTRKEAEFNATFNEVTDWKVLSNPLKILIVASMTSMLSCNFVFVFMDPICFRPFQLTSRICDDFADEGLQSNVLELVRPLGRLVMLVFVLAVIGHCVFVNRVTKIAKQTLANRVSQRTSQGAATST